jgi:Domain of unknown function (DUF4168)
MYSSHHSLLRLTWLKGLFLVVLMIAQFWGSVIPASLAATTPLSEDVLALEQPAPVRSNLGAEDISSEKVSQFVHAYLKVLALVEQREGDLQAAETQLESLRVQQEIETEAFATIESAGLTWQEYLQLLGLANTDPEFGERIVTQLQEIAE